jgi:hypothetical protein
MKQGLRQIQKSVRGLDSTLPAAQVAKILGKFSNTTFDRTTGGAGYSYNQVMNQIAGLITLFGNSTGTDPNAQAAVWAKLEADLAAIQK